MPFSQSKKSRNKVFLPIIFLICFQSFSQNHTEQDTLIITEFKTRISDLTTKEFSWNPSDEIQLSNPPNYIKITVKDKKDSINQNLIGILHEEIKMYDTLWLGNNPTVNLVNLTGGKYKISFINLNNNHKTSKTFSIEPAFYEKWWFNPFVFLVISSILGLIFYFFYLYRLRQQLRLQSVRHELEIKALRAQMNPHFIFNSMNTIDAYILRKRFIEASDCLQKFSKLIRRILENSENQTISITNEIETLRLYIELEQERFSNSFEYEIAIQPDLIQRNYQIPPLLIQPFVENAILHGIRHLETRKGRIIIRLKQSEMGENLICIIEDNGIGRTQSAEINKERRSSHQSMGINLTMERISTYQAIYGNQMETTISDLPEGTRVEIRLPLVLN